MLSLNIKHVFQLKGLSYLNKGIKVITFAKQISEYIHYHKKMNLVLEHM